MESRIQEETITRRLNRLLRTTSGIGQAIVRSADRAEVLNEACRIAVEVGGFRLAWIGFADRSSGEVRPEAWHGEASDYVKTLEVRCDDTPGGRGPTGQAIRTGLPCVVDDLATDRGFTPWRDLASAHDLRSSAALPIPVGETIEAALCVYSSERGDFDPEEVDLLEEVAATLGVGLHTLHLREEQAHTEAQLHERIKELRCLVGLSQLVDGGDATLEEICRGVVDLLPPTWLYPDITCARLRLHEDEFCTSGFRETPWRLAAPLFASEDRVGAIEVFYTEARPSLDEGPFLSEERALLDAVAARVGKVVERVHADEALRLSEERYRRLFEEVPVGLYRTSPDGSFRDVNPALVEMLGYCDAETLLTVPVEEVYGNPDDRRLWREQLDASGSVRGKVVPILRRDGSTVWVRHSARAVSDEEGAIVAYEGAAEDVTDQERRRRAEEALRQSQKLEAIGKLAGGVAHDFNNLLQVGMGLVDLLRLGDLDSDALTEELDAVFRRGAALTRRLLIFARKEETDLRSDELNEIVRETSTMVDRLLKENIRLRLDLADGRLPVRADRGQLEQVLVNLAVNAADAMPNGGELTLSTCREGDRVCLAVEDTGGGIPEGIRDRIFEPFFTTKASGGGSGIGLSVVHGIVAEHGGSVEVNDRDGGGTVLRVLLPKETARGEELEAPVQRPPERMLEGGGERVLVVEDQQSVRRLLCAMLRRLGYSITDVASAEDALALDGPFDVLVTDVVLTGATGPELAREAAERWPDLRIVLMSGYAEDQVLEKAAGPLHFLSKPFDLAALSAVLRRTLA